VLASAEGKSPSLLHFDPSTAIWVLVIFLVLLVLLYLTAWKNVLATLKGREERIRKEIADAEACRAEADAQLRQYKDQLASADAQVQQIIQNASLDAQRLASQIRVRGQQEAEEAKERAARDIDAARDAAIREIYAHAAELSTSIAEKILRRNLNVDDQRELVRSSLEQLPNANRG
jgi:F-type H+-transporting ATPase subunit b